MKHDPMRQGDIERRLSNLAKAPRCGARTRAGASCRQAAVRSRARCRMHGGARGSGGPRGDRNGNFNAGLWTREGRALRETIRARTLGDVAPCPFVERGVEDQDPVEIEDHASVAHAAALACASRCSDRAGAWTPSMPAMGRRLTVRRM